jgi:hypothetical protein
VVDKELNELRLLIRWFWAVYIVESLVDFRMIFTSCKLKALIFLYKDVWPDFFKS